MMWDVFDFMYCVETEWYILDPRVLLWKVSRTYVSFSGPKSPSMYQIHSFNVHSLDQDQVRSQDRPVSARTWLV